MTTYHDAGVNLEGAEAHVSRIAPLVTSTWSDNVVGGFGGFAAGIRIPDGYQAPVLMMSTDGVGTKLELARQTGLWDGVGFDLVAMCVDDLAAVGARPLGFVDYMAVGSLSAERDQRIVASIAPCASTKSWSPFPQTMESFRTIVPPPRPAVCRAPDSITPCTATLGAATLR